MPSAAAARRGAAHAAAGGGGRRAIVHRARLHGQVTRQRLFKAVGREDGWRGGPAGRPMLRGEHCALAAGSCTRTWPPRLSSPSSTGCCCRPAPCSLQTTRRTAAQASKKLWSCRRRWCASAAWRPPWPCGSVPGASLIAQPVSLPLVNRIACRLCCSNAADVLCWYAPPPPVVVAAPQWKCDNCGRNSI
jgi:hypothetical protein